MDVITTKQHQLTAILTINVLTYMPDPDLLYFSSTSIGSSSSSTVSAEKTSCLSLDDLGVAVSPAGRRGRGDAV